MPPITSTTRSTSSRAHEARGVGGEQLARHLGVALQLGTAYGDPDQLDRHPDPGRQVVALLAQQPHHLAADGAAAEQREPQRLTGLPGHHVILSVPAVHCAVVRCLRPAGPPAVPGKTAQAPTSVRSRSSSVSRRTTTVLRPVAHRDHRRPQRVVVVAGHRAAVGARPRHGQQVAGREVAGHELVLDHDVAGLAVLADHAAEHRGGLGVPRRDRAGVVGVVERGADVVAHPAVHRDVGAARAGVEPDLLDGADLVDGAHGRADDRAAGLDGERGHLRRRGRGTRARRSWSARWRAARGRTGRPGWCRRCRTRRRGRARAGRPRARRRPARAARAPAGRRPRSRRCRRSASRCGSAGRAAPARAPRAPGVRRPARRRR